MRPATLLVAVLLAVCCIKEGCSTKTRVIKEVNLRLNVETLVMLIEENNNILTIGDGQFAPNKMASLGSQTSPPSVGFKDFSVKIYEEDGVEYADIEAILQLLIPLASRKTVFLLLASVVLVVWGMHMTVACEDCRNEDDEKNSDTTNPENGHCPPTDCKMDVKPRGQFHVHIHNNNGHVIFCQGHGGEQTITAGSCLDAAESTASPKKPKKSKKEGEMSKEDKRSKEEKEKAFAEFSRFLAKYIETYSGDEVEDKRSKEVKEKSFAKFMSFLAKYMKTYSEKEVEDSD